MSEDVEALRKQELESLELSRQQESLEQIELATKSVPTHTRRTESGKVVTVTGYIRTSSSAVTERAKGSPGRPKVAAQNARFADDRAIPVWPDAVKAQQAAASETVAYEGIEETGVVDQEMLDAEVPVALEIFKGMPQTPPMQELVRILSSLSSVSLTHESDLDEVELARKSIRVSGYSYISKKTGKLVRVNPYNQMRNLINAMGGIRLAAKKGITPNLLDAALPGYDIKSKVFKAKDLPNRPRINNRSSDLMNTLERIEGSRPGTRKIIDVPVIRPGKDGMKTAMSENHPLAAVRNAPNGSTVRRDNMLFKRGNDGLWYKMPRRKFRGYTDREMTAKLAPEPGEIELHIATPTPRKVYDRSRVEMEALNPGSRNYLSTAKYVSALQPAVSQMPSGVADSISGHITVHNNSHKSKGYANVSQVRIKPFTKGMPEFVVHSNAEYEADLLNTLPKQQVHGISVPSTLHPMETVMTKQSAEFVETLINNRAPAEMTDRMYDRFNAAYDKHVKDNGSFSGLRGKEGWLARMSGDRPQEVVDSISDSLSKSATYSPEEFLSEAWVEYVGNPNPRPLSNAMGRALQSAMEEFDDYLYKNKWYNADDIPETKFGKNTKKDYSSRVADVVEGAGDKYTYHVDRTPRDMRDILNSSADYVDVRDSEGNPLFDANVEREGSVGRIQVLDFPKVSAADMDLPEFDDNPYVASRMHMYQKGYSNYIDEGKALQAIQAIEEGLFSDGIDVVEVSPMSQQDSIIYARAGYKFDPEFMDFEDIRSLLDSVDHDLDKMKNSPPQAKTTARRKINEWKKGLSEDPDSWPSPEAIANLGKTDATERSPGERILNMIDWEGYKELQAPESVVTKVRNVPDTPEPESVPEVTPKPSRSKVTPANITKAANDLAYGDSGTAGLRALSNKITSRHKDTFPEISNASVRRPKDTKNPTIAVKVKGEEVMQVEVDISDETTASIRPKMRTDASPMTEEFVQNLSDALREAGYTQVDVDAVEEIQTVRTSERVIPDISDDAAEGLAGAATTSMGKEKEARGSVNNSIKRAAKDLENPDSKSTAGVRAMMNATIQNHDAFKDGQSEFSVKSKFVKNEDGTRTRKSLTLSVAGRDGSDFSVTYSKDDDGYYTVSDMKGTPTQDMARLASELRDNMEESLMQSGAKGLRRQVSENDAAAGFSLAFEGYDWDGYFDESAVRERINQAINSQMEWTERVLTEAVADLIAEKSMSPQDIANQQEKVRKVTNEYRTRIQGEANAILSNDTPLPLQVAMLGVNEFNEVNQIRMNLHRGTDDTPRAPKLRRRRDGSIVNEFVQDAIRSQQVFTEETWEQEKSRRALDSMFDFDGDPDHDSFGEFVGKQAMTFGTYALYKEWRGYAEYFQRLGRAKLGRDTARIIYMLLRLLPASVWRGGLMQSMGPILRKQKNGKMEGIPTKAELMKMASDLESKLPDTPQVRALLTQLRNMGV